MGILKQLGKLVVLILLIITVYFFILASGILAKFLSSDLPPFIYDTYQFLPLLSLIALLIYCLFFLTFIPHIAPLFVDTKTAKLLSDKYIILTFAAIIFFISFSLQIVNLNFISTAPKFTYPNPLIDITCSPIETADPVEGQYMFCSGEAKNLENTSIINMSIVDTDSTGASTNFTSFSFKEVNSSNPKFDDIYMDVGKSGLHKLTMILTQKSLSSTLSPFYANPIVSYSTYYSFTYDEYRKKINDRVTAIFTIISVGIVSVLIAVNNLRDLIQKAEKEIEKRKPDMP